ncbi:peptidoglycan DD-metalloendopeptidase family protein [Planctomycetaceae bacterium SH139]
MPLRKSFSQCCDRHSARRQRRSRRFLLEQLEQRQLLAGDLGQLTVEQWGLQVDPLGAVGVSSSGGSGQNAAEVATARPAWSPDWAGGKPEHLTVIVDQDDFGGGVYDGWRKPLERGFGEEPHDGEHDHPADHGIPFESEGFGRLHRSGGGFSPNNSGAAPNLRLTNTTLLRDASGALVESIPIGQMVAIMVQFETEGIPNGTSFDIGFSMNGVEKVWENITWATGSGNWFAWTSGWYAGPGEHSLSVTLDVNSEVGETNESDNSGQQTFTPHQPTDFDHQLLFPSSGTRNETYVVNNYADVDPRPNLREDFNGGIYQYDGHNAWDLGPTNFADQDAGLPLVAAAAGVVTEIVDGNFDRKTNWDPSDANYVIIDHGNNWNTVYWHLARDSVAVEVGQTVEAGDVIGDMGSSGISTGTHIHYTLRRFNFPVETMYDTETYYHEDADVVYQPSTDTGILYSNISNDNSPHDSDWRESFPTKRVFSRAANDPLVFNYAFSHLLAQETLNIRFVRPSGTVQWSTNWTAPSDRRQSQHYWWIGPSHWKTEVGTWTAEVLKEGQVLVSEPFEVVDGTSPGQIKMTDSSGWNINPGRTTPFDFGSATGSSQTYTIHNHGDSPLLLGEPEIPFGFALNGSFPETVAAGGSSSFSITYFDGFDSKAFGAVRFTTSDPEVPEFWFNVEGTTTGAVPLGVATVTQPGSAVAYQLETAPVYVDSETTYDARGTEPLFFISYWEGGRQPGDLLKIEDQGSGSGQVSVDGNSVLYEGTAVGAFTGGDAPEPLEVLFNEAITPAAIQAILQAIQFESSSDQPGPRYLRTFVIDENFEYSTNAYKSIRVHDPVYQLATVEDIIVNDGGDQRSRVDSLSITFSDEVEVGESAFEVIERQSGNSVDLNVTTELIGGQTVATLVFLGGQVEHGSLVDGNYQLTINGDAIIGSHLQSLDGDGDGLRGGDYVFGDEAADAFFRHFGDVNGDRTVNFVDFLAFRGAFQTDSDDPDFDAAFDVNADAQIGFVDFLAFRSRFGDTLGFT